MQTKIKIKNERKPYSSLEMQRISLPDWLPSLCILCQRPAVQAFCAAYKMV